MNTGEIAASLAALHTELVEGTADRGGAVLNPTDPGLLRSLDRLTAAEASVVHAGGSSIAASVDHVRYGLSLLNRWTSGDDPWSDADFAASWRRTTVTDEEWARVRAALADEARRWTESLRTPREATQPELVTIIGSIAHVAYHLGAIRQIDRATRGPSATD